MEPYLELGVFALGGCCGTTPEYIRRLAALCRGRAPAPRPPVQASVVCTPTLVQRIDGLKMCIRDRSSVVRSATP